MASLQPPAKTRDRGLLICRSSVLLNFSAASPLDLELLHRDSVFYNHNTRNGPTAVGAPTWRGGLTLGHFVSVLDATVTEGQHKI